MEADRPWYLRLFLWTLFPGGFWAWTLFATGSVCYLVGKSQLVPPEVVTTQELQIEEGKPPEKQGKLEQCPICGVTGRRVELEIVPEK